MQSIAVAAVTSQGNFTMPEVYMIAYFAMLACQGTVVQPGAQQIATSAPRHGKLVDAQQTSFVTAQNSQSCLMTAPALLAADFACALGGSANPRRSEFLKIHSQGRFQQAAATGSQALW